MTNIASVLKEEIARLSRREAKKDTEQLKKSSAKYRSEIAALKRRTSALEQQVASLLKVVEKLRPQAEAKVPAKHRFSAARFKAYRQRLDISAQGLGKLLGVTGQTIYSWETGKSRPSSTQLEKIAAIRSLGKRELAKLLEQGAA